MNSSVTPDFDAYTLILHRDEDGDTVLRINEFRGFVTHGDDPVQAISRARELFPLWLESMAETNQEVPLPLDPDALLDNESLLARLNSQIRDLERQNALCGTLLKDVSFAVKPNEDPRDLLGYHCSLLLSEIRQLVSDRSERDRLSASLKVAREGLELLAARTCGSQCTYQEDPQCGMKYPDPKGRCAKCFSVAVLAEIDAANSLNEASPGTTAR